MAEDFTDLYIRYNGHPLFNDELIDSSDSVDNIIMQIEMILFTEPGEVLGDSNLGVGMEHLLWSTKFSADVIKSKIIEQITTYIPELSANSYTVNVYIMPGDFRDIGVVDIQIDQQILRAVFV